MKFETLTTYYVDYGRNKFLELSKKKTVSGGAKFVNISKGYYTNSGERRYQRGIGFPLAGDVISQIIEKLELIEDDVPEK